MKTKICRIPQEVGAGELEGARKAAMGVLLQS